MGTDDRSRIAKEFRGFVAAAAAAPSPLYAELSAAVADDDLALDLLVGLPRPKQQPMLLFGALTFLLGAPPTGPEQLHAVVRDDEDRIREVMLTRFTQTNEPARCAALITALADLDEPVGLVEVGSSAGLCLYPDRYSYEFDGRPVGERSGVHLVTTTTGAVPVPDRVPQVAARVGVDQNPLDPFDGRMASLPVFAYYQLTQPGFPPEFAIDRAWTAALLLIVLVMALNIAGRLISRFFAPTTGR